MYVSAEQLLINCQGIRAQETTTPGQIRESRRDAIETRLLGKFVNSFVRSHVPLLGI